MNAAENIIAKMKALVESTNPEDIERFLRLADVLVDELKRGVAAKEGKEVPHDGSLE